MIAYYRFTTPGISSYTPFFRVSTGKVMAMLDLLLHLDQNLTYLITEFGPGAYLILFSIILLETGCIVTVFLPGDSLLFVAGAGSASGLFALPWLILIFFIAAIAGDILNYCFGHHIGLKVFRERFPELVPDEYIDRTTRYFERYGKKTIFIGRFIPVVRTFAPFLAGIGTMNYRVFMFYNVLSALCWAVAVTGAGYLLGSVPWIREHIGLIILIIIAFTLATVLVIVLLSVNGVLTRERREEKND
ncbi:MAG: VTT domain-containing protein [Methanoregulaceae archaeon]|nr:VTT domain-containing protein [Methanoregulaceae archaeon]